MTYSGPWDNEVSDPIGLAGLLNQVEAGIMVPSSAFVAVTLSYGNWSVIEVEEYQKWTSYHLAPPPSSPKSSPTQLCYIGARGKQWYECKVDSRGGAVKLKVAVDPRKTSYTFHPRIGLLGCPSTFNHLLDSSLVSNTVFPPATGPGPFSYPHPITGGHAPSAYDPTHPYIPGVPASAATNPYAPRSAQPFYPPPTPTGIVMDGEKERILKENRDLKAQLEKYKAGMETGNAALKGLKAKLREQEQATMELRHSTEMTTKDRDFKYEQIAMRLDGMEKENGMLVETVAGMKRKLEISHESQEGLAEALKKQMHTNGRFSALNAGLSDPGPYAKYVKTEEGGAGISRGTSMGARSASASSGGEKSVAEGVEGEEGAATGEQ